MAKRGHTKLPPIRKSRSQPNDGDTDEDEVDEENPQRRRAVEIPWAKNEDWTYRLVDYLEQNPDFRRKLFSDTTKDANAKKRPKNQGKNQKTVSYGILAAWVFDEDNRDNEKLRSSYLEDKMHYNKSVGGQLAQCKKKYHGYCKSLGETGAGLDPEDVWQDSPLSNAIQMIRDEWPFWDHLHALWRELPNYNPIGVSSSASGKEHADTAEQLWGRKEDEQEAGSGIEDVPDEPNEHETSPSVLLDSGGSGAVCRPMDCH
ncbi:hypothetical protein K439DRAFT_1421459 [Ramaria rubella]|nr:hypothetical protein K439DRAFT_1421459 [Ramaria rubella]